MDLISLIITLTVVFFIGSTIEKNHYKKIKKREIALIKKPIISTGKVWDTKRKIKKVELVTGEVVISGDYFKNFTASLRNFFGGRLASFESILDRGRREAILRMREKAIGANFIVNMRIESAMLNDTYMHGTIPQCAIIAYGTAITYE